MKKAWPILAILLAIVLIGGCSYNGMNSSSLEVDNKWANLQGAYQRRADLIPNLVATVKGAANFEKETYIGVAAERAGRGAENLSKAKDVAAENLTPEKMAEINRASAEAQQASRNFISIAVEAYPQLRATENFANLQNQLEGTENRINTERNGYNGTVKEYNQKVSSFPRNLIAGMFGFKKREMFVADEGAKNAPKVQF